MPTDDEKKPLRYLLGLGELIAQGRVARRSKLLQELSKAQAAHAAQLVKTNQAKAKAAAALTNLNAAISASAGPEVIKLMTYMLVRAKAEVKSAEYKLGNAKIRVSGIQRELAGT